MVNRFTTLLILLLLGITSACAAELTARVDRHQLNQEEHILLTLELINSDTRLRAEGVKPNIDLTLLSDNFTLSRPSASNHYNIYQGRGRSRSTLTVTLFPKAAGRFTLPPFEVDGLRTQPITVEVTAASSAAPPALFVRSGSNKNSLWVNEQLVVYLDLYHRVTINKASLGDNLETEPTQIELLPYWKLEPSRRQEQFQGYTYDVERTAWAIFPQTSGRLTVQLPDVWVVSQQAGETQQRLEHQRLNVEVKPLPADLPADIIIGKPTIEQTRLPQQNPQHQLTHWTVTVTAPVAVTTLPERLPTAALPEGLRLYADTARRDTTLDSSGIIDRADYVLSIMPQQSGQFELPPLQIPYFDPILGQADYIELPGQTLNINPAPLPKSQNSPLPAITTPTPQGGLNIKLGDWFWPTTSALFATLWLITLQRGRRQRPAPATTTPQETAAPAPQTPRHPLQQQLLKALNSTTLEAGLTQWQKDHPDEQHVATAVRAVQRLCYGKGQTDDDSATQQVNKAITILNHPAITTREKKPDPWQPEAFTVGKIIKNKPH